MGGHAFCFGKTPDRELTRIARNRHFGIVVQDPVLRLEIADLPPASGLAGAGVGIDRPADWRREIEIARVAVGPDRTDMIGLLPFSADDQHHLVSRTLLGRTGISR